MTPELPPEFINLVTWLGAIFAGLIVAHRYIVQYFNPPEKKQGGAMDTQIALVGGALADRTSTMELARAIDEHSEMTKRLLDAIDRHTAATIRMIDTMDQSNRDQDRRREMEELRRDLHDSRREIDRLRSTR
jgi:hypothetical protein